MNLKDLLSKLIFSIINLVVWVGHITLSPFKKLSSIVKKLKSIEIKVKLPKPHFPLKAFKDRLSTLISKLTESVKDIKISLPSLPIRAKESREVVAKEKAPRNIRAFILGVLASLIFIYLPFQLLNWWRELPQPELLAHIQKSSTRILDRNDRLLYEIYIDRSYDPVSLEDIPEHVINATLAIEDAAFYEHSGIKLTSMLRALKTTIFEGTLQGGSTITQQLVKNVLLTPERTLTRKTKEVVVALLAERRYTKDEILEMYMNNIPYGGTSWGIQSASQKFFGKDVGSLDLAEASFLAGLPSAPSTFSPFSGGLGYAKERQMQVLERMLVLGYISEVDVSSAYKQELTFSSQGEYIGAPHFVNYVRNILENTYGSRFVTLGGLTIKTTLDLDLQQEVQMIVRNEVIGSGSYLSFSNGAAIVVDSKNGEILAYVGSYDYFDNENDGQVDIITSFRQPGSSIKPVTYALALENGFTASSILEDEEFAVNVNGKVYSPVNYDGKYRGEVALRESLASSYNIPAVKLAQALGPDNIVELGGKMGLTNYKVDDSYGLSITLGGKEVKLLDHVNVFATFARGGVVKDTAAVLSVIDSKGFEIYRGSDKDGKRVLSEGVSYLISHILSDNNARSPAFGSYSLLNIPSYQVAVKTGTTDNKRDNWAMGYTPSYAVGVWVGNNDNTPMNPYLSSGLSGASPIWNKIMHVLLDGTKPEYFIPPSSVFTKVDDKCEGKSEIFIKGTSPEHLCDIKEKDGDSKKKDKN